MYLYKQLELATNLMQQIYHTEDGISREFEEKINEIITNPKSSKYIQLLAELELIHYKSEQLILNLILLIELGYTDVVESKFSEINSILKFRISCS